MRSPIVYKCPNTGEQVEHWMAEPIIDGSRSDREAVKTAILCRVCSKLHFLDKSNGKLFGEK